MNTKTILLATLAASVAATNVNLTVNVDDAYELLLDGERVTTQQNSWNSNQSFDYDLGQAPKHVLSIVAIDFGGGYRAAVEINGHGTKRTDWYCVGENAVNRSPDISFAAVDFDDNAWKMAGNGNSGSINDGEVFWADGYGQKTTVYCRYHGDLLDSYTGPPPVTKEQVDALRAELELVHADNQFWSEQNEQREADAAYIDHDLAQARAETNNHNNNLELDISNLDIDLMGLADKLQEQDVAHVANLQEIQNQMMANLQELQMDFDDEIDRQNDILISQVEDYASIMDACDAHNQDADQIICAHINIHQHTAEVEAHGEY